MKKAIDIIESARSYYLLSNDKKSKPIHIGNRIKLEYALQGVKATMIIATAGSVKRGKCIVLVDYPTEDILLFKQRAENKVLRIKSVN